jgi:RNA polymerase sigma-70 factor (ECF subfamily)
MDAVAETMLVAWRRLEDLPAERELPWLYGTARRVLANQRRSTHRRDELHRRLAAEVRGAMVEPHPEPSLRDAMRSLSPDDQELLRLVCWEGLGVADVAAVLGCTANAASIRLHRARGLLRSALEPAERSGEVRTQAARKDSCR